MVREPVRAWIRWSAWFCLSLMLWAAAAESTHTHATRTESSTCSICVVAHSASPTLSFSHVVPFFAAIGLLREEDPVAKARLDFSEAGIRGPPTL
ncbi:MAG TPA: hypothetical protein VH350_18445 [Candidatus Sulfotelmatobacter sp.]|jgi:hypothetical protein|nr:hypothetical protein [Candidatus Sulfotelmatobacter sp.]